jgi:hypothetical protein
MRDSSLDGDLQRVDRYLASLSARVEPDPRHRAALRQELLRRHQELLAGDSQRSATTLWLHVKELKRLTLVAPPALAGVLALLVILFGLQISGHRSTQEAEAARINRALAHATRTVTAWQVTFHQQKGNSASSSQCTLPLHLYPRDGKMYLYKNGTWFQVTPAAAAGLDCPSQLQWVFASLPARLAHGNFHLLPARRLGGRWVDGVQYSTRSRATRVTATVWVGRASGLVLRAGRVTTRDGRVIERDAVSYSYVRAQS